MLDGIEESRNKEEGKKKVEEQNRNFRIRFFLDCEEKSWDSGAIFCIRIAKGFQV